MWSGVLDRSRIPLSYSIISVASQIDHYTDFYSLINIHTYAIQKEIDFDDSFGGDSAILRCTVAKQQIKPKAEKKAKEGKVNSEVNAPSPGTSANATATADNTNMTDMPLSMSDDTEDLENVNVNVDRPSLTLMSASLVLDSPLSPQVEVPVSMSVSSISISSTSHPDGDADSTDTVPAALSVSIAIEGKEKSGDNGSISNSGHNSGAGAVGDVGNADDIGQEPNLELDAGAFTGAGVLGFAKAKAKAEAEAESTLKDTDTSGDGIGKDKNRGKDKDKGRNMSNRIYMNTRKSPEKSSLSKFNKTNKDKGKGRGSPSDTSHTQQLGLSLSGSSLSISIDTLDALDTSKLDSPPKAKKSPSKPSKVSVTALQTTAEIAEINTLHSQESPAKHSTEHILLVSPQSGPNSGQKSFGGDSSPPSNIAGRFMLDFRGLYLHTVVVLFHVELCIRQLWSSSIRSCNITSIVYNQYTDIYPFKTYLNLYLCICRGVACRLGRTSKSRAVW